MRRGSGQTIPFVALVLVLFGVIVVGAAPLRYGVGFQLLNADTIDLAGGYWAADVMIYVYNESSGAFIDYDLRLQNMGRSVRVEKLPRYKGSRYFGTLFFFADASNFPFDSQRLEITIQDPQLNSSQMEWYLLDNLTFVDPALRLRGWFWDTAQPFTHVVGNQTYAATGESFSTLSLFWRVSRSYVISVQMFIPPALMLVSVFVSYSIPITQSVTRLGIVQSALVSEALLHTGLVRTTATGTIMLFDYFMILCYIVIILSIVENIVVMVLMRGNKSRQALGQWIESRAKIFVWLFCPGLFTIIFLPIWAAILIIVLPPLSVFSFRAIYRKYIEYRNSKKTQKEEESEETSDEENRTRLAEQAPAEDNNDYRNAVIENELKKAGSKGPRKVELPTDWRDSDEESEN